MLRGQVGEDEAPRRRRGYEVIGELVLATTLASRLRRQANARGVTALTLAREWLAERILDEPDP